MAGVRGLTPQAFGVFLAPRCGFCGLGCELSGLWGVHPSDLMAVKWQRYRLREVKSAKIRRSTVNVPILIV